MAEDIPGVRILSVSRWKINRANGPEQDSTPDTSDG
jgi:hypothetical protein